MSACFVPGCPSRRYGRGMCRNHYMRLYRGRPNWSAKVARRLSHDEAENVRRAYQAGVPRKDLATGYGVSVVAVWYITKGLRHRSCET